MMIIIKLPKFTRPLYGVGEHNTKNNFLFLFLKPKYGPFGFNRRKFCLQLYKLNEIE